MAKDNREIASEITVAYLHAVANLTAEPTREALLKPEAVSKFYRAMHEAVKKSEVEDKPGVVEWTDI